MKYLSVSTVLRAITTAMLFVALTKLPYEYFTILRLVTCFTSAYMIYVAVMTKKPAWIVVFGFFILLFIPIKMFSIKREVWTVVDVIVGLTMLASILLVGENLRAPKHQESEKSQV